MRLSSYLLCVWFVYVSAIANADDNNPEEFLKSKGLRKSGNRFVLIEETVLRKKLREAERLQKKVISAQRDAALWRVQVKNKKQLMIEYLQKRRELRAQLPHARTVKVNNRIVTMLNELADRINLMNSSDQLEQKLQEARSVANQETQNYVERLMEACQLHETISKQYEDLSRDDKVVRAIFACGESDGKQYKLAPGATFLGSSRRMKKLENLVLSDDVDIRRSRSGLWYIPVTFNGKKTKEMAIDTGASIIAIPWSMAKEVGLAPDDKSPIIRITVADGRKFEARRVVASNVRVGKFAVQNVACAVMPPGHVDTIALLGQSFLEHFVYKIDTVNSKLVMTKVESDSNENRKKAKRGKQ